MSVIINTLITIGCTVVNSANMTEISAKIIPSFIFQYQHWSYIRGHHPRLWPTFYVPYVPFLAVSSYIFFKLDDPVRPGAQAKEGH
jgi:hypothetical protein